MGGSSEQTTIILAAAALLVIIVLVVAAVSGKKRGMKWLFGLLILGLISYLLISAEVFRIS